MDALEQRNEILRTSRDNVYATSMINNSAINDQTPSIPCEFTIEDTSPICNTVQDYAVSVVRFKIPTTVVPLAIFEEDQYTIGFSLSGDTHASPVVRKVEYVIRAPFALNASYPESHFYYNYTEFLSNINLTLAEVWGDAFANGAYAPALAGMSATRPPYFRLLDSTNILELILPNNGTVQYPWYGTYPPASTNNQAISIIMSEKLAYYFSGFSIKRSLPIPNSTPVTPNSKPCTYRMQLPMTDATLVSLPATATAPPQNPPALFRRLREDYSSLQLWNTLTRIFITSDLAVAGETVATRTGSRGSNGNAEEVRNISILTDFTLEPNESGLIRDSVYIAPDANPRWLDITAMGALYRMNLRVFYQTKDLKVYPLPLMNGSQAEIRLHFRRRRARDQMQFSLAPLASNLFRPVDPVVQERANTAIQHAGGSVYIAPKTKKTDKKKTLLLK